MRQALMVIEDRERTAGKRPRWSKPAVHRLTNRWFSLNAAHGFTLIELVVSISVGALISGAAGMILWNATKIRAQTSARSDLIDEGSAGLEVLLRYIREIRQDECPGGPTPCLNGNAQVTLADAADLRFDVYDQVTSTSRSYGCRQNGNLVELSNDGGTTWYPLLGDVTSLAFSYYGWTTGTEAPTSLTSLPLSGVTRNQIRRIGIQIDLARGTQTARLRTSIYLRNFMNEVINAP